MNAIRFWAGELVEPASVKKFTIDQVIREILGTMRPKFSTGEICRRFSIERVTLGPIRKELGTNPSEPIERTLLANFLQSRWIGACPIRQAQN